VDVFERAALVEGALERDCIIELPTAVDRVV
jgi:hypothetical protein